MPKGVGVQIPSKPPIYKGEYMTTDAICSIKFKLIPVGNSFMWNNKLWTKINDDNAKRFTDENIIMSFPLDFKVDISMTHAERILGPQTECGGWGNPEE